MPFAPVRIRSDTAGSAPGKAGAGFVQHRTGHVSGFASCISPDRAAPIIVHGRIIQPVGVGQIPEGLIDRFGPLDLEMKTVMKAVVGQSRYSGCHVRVAVRCNNSAWGM